jgi:hypothetical protein
MVSRSYKDFAPSHKAPPDPACKRIGDVPAHERFEGFFLPFLYANSTLLRQITEGDNIPSGSSIGYPAGPRWNACTGLGVPNGESLFVALTQGQ